MKVLALAAIISVACPLASSSAGDDKPLPKDISAAASGMEASMSLRHARDRTEILFFQTDSRIPDVDAAASAKGIANDTKAFGQALEKLKGQASVDADLGTRLGGLRTQSAKIQDIGVKLSAECAKASPDFGVIAKVSGELWQALDLADADMIALLKSMKVVRRLPPKTGSGNQSSQPADPAATYGKGFRPHAAAVYQRAILDNARVLSHYAGSAEPVPDAVVADHLAEIERQLAALKKEYSKLDDSFRKENKLEQEIKDVESQQSKMAGQVDRMKKTSTARALNPTELKETSNLIYKSTSATLGQLNRMMGQFNTQPVPHEDPLYSP